MPLLPAEIYLPNKNKYIVNSRSFTNENDKDKYVKELIEAYEKGREDLRHEFKFLLGINDD